MDFIALAQECATQVHPVTMAAVANVESGFNPYAIGVVGGRLVRQPKNKAEAVATAKELARNGWNFSVGTAQVNRFNFDKYGLDVESAFDPCLNLRAGSGILKDCYTRALPKYGDPQKALQAAFSCYYSGNFTTGFKPDFKGQPSYVAKVLASANAVASTSSAKAIPVADGSKAQKPAATIPQVKVSPEATKAEITAMVPQIGSSPVVLQTSSPAVVAKPKPRNVPLKYDGFASDDSISGNGFDGFAADTE